MMRGRTYLLLVGYLACWIVTPAIHAQSLIDKQRKVGLGADGRVVVPTNQVLTPTGKQVEFRSRPTDLSLSPDGRWLAVLSHDSVLIIDVDKGKVAAKENVPGGSYAGILFSSDSKTIFCSTFAKKGGEILRFSVGENGKLEQGAPILEERPGAIPVGLAFGRNGRSLLAALNLRNTVVELDIETGKLIREIQVGNAPCQLVVSGKYAYVTNWGGRRPVKGELTGPSGKGKRVKVDPKRHIASEGSVSIIDLDSGKVAREIVVGLHPTGIVSSKDGKFIAIANANSDTVSILDVGTALTENSAPIETIDLRPQIDFPFGSTPNELAFAPDGKRLYVANGTNNAVAVIAFEPGRSKLLGLIPTGWYPAGIVLDSARNQLYVANVKGVGSLDKSWEGRRKLKGKVVFGYNSKDHRGSVSLIPLPNDRELATLTASVLENNRQTMTVSALAPARANCPALPVPERHGEPSIFKHVVYIIKENRTYDQVFGDMPQGEGRADLCIYGREVTPNCHKIAEEFVLLDNFYCSSVLSADGHQWAMEAFVTGYLERAFGGWPRSYPYEGDDALAYSGGGFLWDNALAHKKTLRIYGEFVKGSVKWRDPTRKKAPTFLECYHDFLSGNRNIEIKATAGIKTIEPYLCTTSIGFPQTVPDVYRAAEFIKELKAFEASGNFPNLSIMLLPNDHTAGTREGRPTPEACVADNDVALGRVIEAISKSKFWPETCIMVVQDDPQNGWDHIDGHRTVAMVVSPYTKRRAVVSTNYNQTGMVRTIEMMLGLPPMNQFDASATPMSDCFVEKGDFTPYTAVPNRIPLDKMNPSLKSILNARQLHWATKSMGLPLDDVDEADEDILNRILWHAARGTDETYPKEFINEKDDDDD